MVEDPGKELDYKTPQFLKNRVFLITAGAILFLAVAGGVYSIFMLGNGNSAGDAASREDADSGPQGEEVVEIAEVLPQNRRYSDDLEFELDDWPAAGMPVDPFADPMRLTGVVVGGYGGTMAIIESSNTSYIVSVGDYIDDIWLVYRISRDGAVLRAGGQEIYIYLHHPPVVEPVEREPEVEAEEGD